MSLADDLTTLSLGIAAEKGIRQVDTEREPFEYHSGTDLGDFQKQLNPCARYSEVIVWVCWDHTLAVDDHLDKRSVVQELVSIIAHNYFAEAETYHVTEPRESLHRKDDFMMLVIDTQRSCAGHSCGDVAVYVVDVNGEIVTRNNLFDQDICAIFLEAVVVVVESQIVRISPTGANTCNQTVIKAWF